MTGQRRFLIFCIIIFCGMFMGQVLFAHEVEKNIEAADRLYTQRDDLAKAAEAIELLEHVLESEPDNVQALWRLARVIRWMGTHSPKDKKLEIFTTATDYAEKSVELDDECADCHFWLGVNYGSYGLTKGILKSFFLIKPLKKEMNRVIELDPIFQNGAAYMVLGKLYRAVPRIVGGNKKESLKLLQKAVEIGPENILNRLELALTLISLRKREEAKKELEWILALPYQTDPGDREDKLEAKKAYEKEFKEEEE